MSGLSEHSCRLRLENSNFSPLLGSVRSLLEIIYFFAKIGVNTTKKVLAFLGGGDICSRRILRLEDCEVTGLFRGNGC